MHSCINARNVLLMSDYYEEEQTILREPIQPQKYNIVLTRDGREVSFDFSPATAESITRFGYLEPLDSRCGSGLVEEEDQLYTKLSPVIGKSFMGELAFHTQKQTIISLHETAILGYQRQKIIDPRISNEIATFWEIYLDQRIFPQSLENDWCDLMAQIIISEINNEGADRELAEDIKDKLLEQAAEEFSDDDN